MRQGPSQDAGEQQPDRDVNQGRSRGFPGRRDEAVKYGRQFVAITGASGSGKSTMLGLIAGLAAVVDTVAVWPYRLVVSSSERTAAVDAAALAVMRVDADVYAFRDRLTATITGADAGRLAPKGFPRSNRFS